MAQAKYFNKQQLIDLGIIDVDKNGEWIKISTGKTNRASDAQNGYRNFQWRFNKNTYKMSSHRLVYLWYNETIPEGYQVEHWDKDGCNNNINNLCALPARLDGKLYAQILLREKTKKLSKIENS